MASRSRARRALGLAARVLGAVVLVWVALFGLARTHLVNAEGVRMAAALPLGRNFGRAAPGVYRMGQPPVVQQELLDGIYDFRTVVNLAWTGSPRDLAERAFYESKNVRYVALPFTDQHLPDPAALAEALALLDTAPRPIVVHCRAGRDRTGGLLALWKRVHGATPADVRRDWLWHGTPHPAWRDAALAPTLPAGLEHPQVAGTSGVAASAN